MKTLPTKMESIDNATLGCIDEIGEMAVRDLFFSTAYADYFAIGIPIIAAIGIFGNLIAVWVNNHRKLTGLSIMLLNALMISDVGFLISALFMYVPRGHIAKLFTPEDCARHTAEFWEMIEWTQRLYVVCHPIFDLAVCLIVWYTFAVVLEQYAFFYCQERLAKISKSKSNGVKIVVTVFNVVIIMSLIHFFKFVRREALYGSVEHKKICLSDIYISPGYMNYEVYVYFGIMVLLPWLPIFVGIIRIGIEICQRRKEMRLWPHESPDKGLTLILREGRSRKTVMTIAVVFLITYGIGTMSFAYIVSVTGIVNDLIPCYVVPMDRRFAVIENSLQMEFLFVTPLLIYSSSKFFIYYATGKTFRRIFHLMISRMYRRLSSIVHMCTNARWKPHDLPAKSHSSTPASSVYRHRYKSKNLSIEMDRRRSLEFALIEHDKTIRTVHHDGRPPQIRSIPPPILNPKTLNQSKKSSSTVSSIDVEYHRNNHFVNKPLSVGNIKESNHVDAVHTITPVAIPVNKQPRGRKTKAPPIIRPYVFYTPPSVWETPI